VSQSGEPARSPLEQLAAASGREFPNLLKARALRMTHLQVFGNIQAEGTRLSELAAWAGMTRPSMAELVDELEGQGLVERRPDPTDGRAKLICLTPRGWQAIRIGRGIIDRIEADYAQRLGPRRFDAMCWTLQELLDNLIGTPVRGARDNLPDTPSKGRRAN
jgi:DNA-binding MarR family transcriptional regulator